jgi:hypothetical protein
MVAESFRSAACGDEGVRAVDLSAKLPKMPKVVSRDG